MITRISTGKENYICMLLTNWSNRAKGMGLTTPKCEFRRFMQHKRKRLSYYSVKQKDKQEEERGCKKA